jgi:hypothetical protein
MTVQFNMIHQTNADGNMPTNSVVTYNTGINAPGGPVEFMIVRGKITYAADPTAGDFTNLLNTMRITLNGEVVFDWRDNLPAGANPNANSAPGRFGYLINSIGGRAYENPSGTTTREFYWGIPLGRQTPSGVNRYEITMTWHAAAAALSAGTGTLQFWLRTNNAMQQTTTVCPSTSFTHSNSIEQVVVRIPQNVPGVVSAILVNNDSYANEFGTQGIRINALGAYGLEKDFWLWLNSDLANGIMYRDDGSTSQQTWAYEAKGSTLLPCFGLAGGDVVLQVDSSAATTRTYLPVLTHQIGARAAKDVRQTQSAPGNTAKTIVARTEN